MPANPNKLSQFWQELKRRKVVRVITVYAASAFVILEAVDIIFPRMGFPDWTVTFVIFLIVIGFIITVILSWVYDIKPEGGIVKTKPAEDETREDKQVSSKGWKIASYFSFVVIVGLIILNVIPGSENKEIPDKSIAVLPFINDSTDDENEYFINGTMEAILDNLCKIENLRVPGRTSVEQYRNALKPIPVIAEEMDVSYILEGSGQRDGNRILLTVQLLDAKKDEHIWSDTYNREIEDRFALQAEIAEIIADEIEAIITPKERELIESIPTSNLTAYDFYQRGREEHWKYWSDNNNQPALNRAEKLYFKALEYDSLFAKAYAGLAIIYWDKYYWHEYLSEEFLDSVLTLCQTALSFDNQLSEAYVTRGNYFGSRGEIDKAHQEYDRALLYNPNSWEAYWSKGLLYSNFFDLIKSIDNITKAIALNRGPMLPVFLKGLGWQYSLVDFPEKFRYYLDEALKLDNDTADFYYNLCLNEYIHCNFKKAVEYGEIAFDMDSVNVTIEDLEILIQANYLAGNYSEALRHVNELFEKRKSGGQEGLSTNYTIGYILWVNGYEDEANEFYDEMIKNFNRLSELGRLYALRAGFYYDLAGIYSFREETDKSFDNLRFIKNTEHVFIGNIMGLQYDPLFNNIRDESEFQQILSDMKSKYQAEHEKVRQWLEENEML